MKVHLSDEGDRLEEKGTPTIDGSAAQKELIERLRGICIELLGDMAGRPLEMLSRTRFTSRDLLLTCKEIESFTRMFVDEKKASLIGMEMRKVLMRQVLNKMGQ